MARRNLNRDYIRKILNIEAPNGYKFDLANYLHNPAYGYDYPAFVKKLDEDENTETFRRVYYMKYYGGDGEYKEETYTREKNGGAWQVVHTISEKVLESSKRFNINKLLTFC